MHDLKKHAQETPLTPSAGLILAVEPDRWFYWADKLGLLVWQGMPAMTAG